MILGRNDVLFRPMVNDEQEVDGLVLDCGGSITDPDGWLCSCCLTEALPFYHHSDENEFLIQCPVCVY